MKMSNLSDLLTHELMDLHDAETQLIAALPRLAEAATNSDLEEAFRSHLEETRNHLERLEEALRKMDQEADGETCESMRGLLEEGESFLEADAPSRVKDAALIVAAQKVEHYEIASYGSARSLAHQMGMSDIADLLAQTLKEESAADDLLTRIALDSVNPWAASA